MKYHSILHGHVCVMGNGMQVSLLRLVDQLDVIYMYFLFFVVSLDANLKVNCS